MAAPDRRVLALVVLLGLSLASGIESADAFRGWCRRDPIFQIDGQNAHVVIAVNVRDLHTAQKLSTGEPVKVALTVPVGVNASHLASDNAFGAGYDVSIEQSRRLKAGDRTIPVGVAVYVPMTDPSLPVRVTFAPAGSGRSETTAGGSVPDGRFLASGAGDGTASAWISFTAGA